MERVFIEKMIVLRRPSAARLTTGNTIIKGAFPARAESKAGHQKRTHVDNEPVESAAGSAPQSIHRHRPVRVYRDATEPNRCGHERSKQTGKWNSYRSRLRADGEGMVYSG